METYPLSLTTLPNLQVSYDSESRTGLHLVLDLPLFSFIQWLTFLSLFTNSRLFRHKDVSTPSSVPCFTEDYLLNPFQCTLYRKLDTNSTVNPTVSSFPYEPPPCHIVSGPSPSTYGCVLCFFTTRNRLRDPYGSLHYSLFRSFSPNKFHHLVEHAVRFLTPKTSHSWPLDIF